LSLVVIGILVHVNYYRPWKRKRRLKQPAKVWFSDGTGPNQNECRVSANDYPVVQLRIHPNLDYEETGIIFGFRGDEGSRPQPYAMINTFVKQGQLRDQSPADNPNHSIDNKYRYQVREVRRRSTAKEYTLRFRVKTRAPGRYKVIMHILAEDRQGRPDKNMYLIVEEPDPPETH